MCLLLSSRSSLSAGEQKTDSSLQTLTCTVCIHAHTYHYLWIEGFGGFVFFDLAETNNVDITWSNISYTAGILNHIQLNPVYITMNTEGDCTVFTKLVHFTHRHLVGGGCRQDNLFILARLKAVIYQECEAPLQMAV